MKVIVFLLFISINTMGQTVSKNVFFDQPAPGPSPVLFAPGIVSDEFGNRDMAISPSGDELFYTLQYRNGLISTIMHARKVNGKWSMPEVATFCGKFNDLEPAFSPDGSKLYFSSSRPINAEAKDDYDIWYVTKTAGEWGPPQNLGSPVNTTRNEFYASVARSGNIYFTREMDGKDEDIVMCRYSNNQFDTAVSLPDGINSTGGEFNAFVDPDEQYILFTGYKRKDAIGSGDIYISKKNSSGVWTEAKDLGSLINAPGLTYCPYVSPDKKYFFFSSSRHGIKVPFDKPQDIKSLKYILHNPLNSWDNIYWVDAKMILTTGP